MLTLNTNVFLLAYFFHENVKFFRFDTSQLCMLFDCREETLYQVHVSLFF
jgi:hypothetical protein